MTTLTYAIVIGNTNTKIGLIDRSLLSCLQKSTVPSSIAIESVVKAITDINARNHIETPLPVVICSVVKPLTAGIINSLSAIVAPEHIKIVACDSTLPFTVRYNRPESLGADRIADCLYAFKKYPRETCIIIDAGTAITVNVLTGEGIFDGGFIFPGPGTQLRSLHEMTSQLPHIDRVTASDDFPPHATETAMTGGVRYCAAGGISLIVHALQRSFPAPTRVLACGGSWEPLESLIDFDYEFIQDLTIVGAGLYGEE
jgi:type III pantothenate kinase